MLRAFHSLTLGRLVAKRSARVMDRLGIPDGLCCDIPNVAALSVTRWWDGRHYYGTLAIGEESSDVEGVLDASWARRLTRDGHDGYVFHAGQTSRRFYDEQALIAETIRQLPASVLVLIRGTAWDNPRKCEVLWTR